MHIFYSIVPNGKVLLFEYENAKSILQIYTPLREYHTVHKGFLSMLKHCPFYNRTAPLKTVLRKF